MKERINFRGFDFEFNFSYQPEEKQTLEYGGCSEEFEIYDITLNGIDASLLLEDCIEDIEQEIIKKLKDVR